MTVEYSGPFIHIHIDANELKDKHQSVTLADGYTYERIIIRYLSNISELHPYQVVHEGDRITYPPVNCKSPINFYLFITDITKEADIRLSIEKFGQIPDPDYFNKAFNPILVTGDDGNKYNVIPSDQFK